MHTHPCGRDGGIGRSKMLSSTQWIQKTLRKNQQPSNKALKCRFSANKTPENVLSSNNIYTDL